VEIRGDGEIRACIEELTSKYRAHDIQVTVPRSGVSGNVGIEASVSSHKGFKADLDSTRKYFESLPYVVYAIESL